MTHPPLSAHATADEPSAARLARLARWSVTGRIAEAELELHAWQRRGDCPASARILLAALLARRDQIEHALAVARKGRSAGDARLTQLLIALLVEAGLTDEAHAEADALAREHGDEHGITHWLECAGFDAPPARGLNAGADECLTDALAAQPHALSSLVAALRIEPNDGDAAVLRAAAEPLYDRLTDDHQRLTVCQAMADLALLAGDRPAARRWAHRGLAIQPYVAALALVLAQTGDDAADGPPAAQVLRRNAEAHPTYPDVQAALVRRLVADGQSDEAQRALLRWADHAPGHRLVEQVRKELAA